MNSHKKKELSEDLHDAQKVELQQACKQQENLEDSSKQLLEQENVLQVNSNVTHGLISHKNDLSLEKLVKEVGFSPSTSQFPPLVMPMFTVGKIGESDSISVSASEASPLYLDADISFSGPSVLISTRKNRHPNSPEPVQVHTSPINSQIEEIMGCNYFTLQQKSQQTLRRVLVVDDCPFNIVAVQSLLSQLNVDSDFCCNG